LASGSGTQASEDAVSDIGTDVDTPRRIGTPRGIRRERDLPLAGQRDKYNEQVRNLDNQVCFVEAPHPLMNTKRRAMYIYNFATFYTCLILKIKLFLFVLVLCLKAFLLKRSFLLKSVSVSPALVFI
jgi:hypothetical protein